MMTRSPAPDTPWNLPSLRRTICSHCATTRTLDARNQPDEQACEDRERQRSFGSSVEAMSAARPAPTAIDMMKRREDTLEAGRMRGTYARICCAGRRAVPEDALRSRVMTDAKGPLGEAFRRCRDLDALLKNPDVGAAFAERGVNISLALVAVDGLRAYLEGDKARAAEEFGTVAEEVASRMAASRELAKDKPS